MLSSKVVIPEGYEENSVSFDLTVKLKHLDISLTEELSISPLSNLYGYTYRKKELSNSLIVFTIVEWNSFLGEITLREKTEATTNITLLELEVTDFTALPEKSGTSTKIIKIKQIFLRTVSRLNESGLAHINPLQLTDKLNGKFKLREGVQERIRFVHRLQLAGAKISSSTKKIGISYHSYKKYCKQVTGENPILGHSNIQRQQDIIDEIITEWKEKIENR